MSITEDPKRVAGKTRWSMAARCARMASLALLGADPAPLTAREEGRFQRGKDAQRFHGRRLTAKYGEEHVIHEKAVPWPNPVPIGELHTDLVVVPERLAIEVKSSESVDSMFEAAMTQLAGQVHYDEDVDKGLLVFLDRDYQETDAFPLILTGEWVEIVEGIAKKVVHAGKTGELPERICARPSDGLSHLCPLIDKCFEGWEPPPAAEMKDAAAIATRAYLAKRALDSAKGELAPLEEEYDAAKQALLEAGFPEGDTIAGPVLVKHTMVRGSHTFSLAKARKSGVWTGVDDERFHAFVSQNSGHSRWTFERVGDEPLDLGLDDDEAPF